MTSMVYLALSTSRLGVRWSSAEAAASVARWRRVCRGRRARRDHRPVIGDARSGSASILADAPSTASSRRHRSGRAAAGFNEAIECLGGLEILIAAQGIALPREAIRHELEAWDRTLETNLTSVFEFCQSPLASWPQPARQDHHDRFDAELFGRSQRCRVRRKQGRSRSADEGARQRVGAARHQRERDRPRLHQDRSEPAHLA